MKKASFWGEGWGRLKTRKALQIKEISAFIKGKKWGSKWGKCQKRVKNSTFVSKGQKCENGQNAPKIAKNPVFSGFFVAQRRGFEPPDTFLHHTISNRAP